MLWFEEMEMGAFCRLGVGMNMVTKSVMKPLSVSVGIDAA
jgi:hypothetical protein